MGLKINSICLKTYVLLVLRVLNGPLPIVLCKWNPYDLIDVLGPFSLILQPWNFCKIEFSYISSGLEANEKNHKNTSIFRRLTRI